MKYSSRNLKWIDQLDFFSIPLPLFLNLFISHHIVDIIKTIKRGHLRLNDNQLLEIDSSTDVSGVVVMKFVALLMLAALTSLVEASPLLPCKLDSSVIVVAVIADFFVEGVSVVVASPDPSIQPSIHPSIQPSCKSSSGKGNSSKGR